MLYNWLTAVSTLHNMPEIDPRFWDRRPPEGTSLYADWDNGSTTDHSIIGATATKGSAVTIGIDANGVAYAEGPGTNSLNNSISFPDRDEYSFTDGAGQDLAMSFSGWYYADAYTTGDKIGLLISKAIAFNSGFEWQIIAGAGAGNPFSWGGAHLRFSNPTGVFDLINTTTSNTISTWTHICCTYSGNEATTGLNVYINGTLVAGSKSKNASYVGMTNSTGVLRLMGLSSGQCFDGKISKFLLLKNRVLTADEVKQIAEAGPRG